MKHKNEIDVFRKWNNKYVLANGVSHHDIKT